MFYFYNLEIKTCPKYDGLFTSKLYWKIKLIQKITPSQSQFFFGFRFQIHRLR